MSDFDAIVVGAGCAGSVAAYTLASAGKSVLVVERGQYAGAKNMTGGRIYTHSLAKVFPNYQEAPLQRKVTHERISLMSPDSNFTIGAVTSEEPGSALARIAKEAAFNNVSRKLNGFLSTNSNLMNSRSLLGKTSLGGEEGVNAVSEDYNIRGNLVTKCKNALYLTIFNNEVFNCDAVNKFSTSIFSLLCQPLVKGATQYGVGLLTSLFELTG